ncbi:MAG TPA: hypothetical protein VH500_09235 [Nitrososphaeraceae archaeon]|jgi:hypothetical protein
MSALLFLVVAVAAIAITVFIMTSTIGVKAQSLNESDLTRIKIGQEFVKDCNKEDGRNPNAYLTFMASVKCTNTLNKLKNMTDGDEIYRETMNIQLALAN